MEFWWSKDWRVVHLDLKMASRVIRTAFIRNNNILFKDLYFSFLWLLLHCVMSVKCQVPKNIEALLRRNIEAVGSWTAIWAVARPRPPNSSTFFFDV